MRIITFVQIVISDSYSTIHTVHYTNPQTNSLPPQAAESLWHLPLTPEYSYTYLLTCCFQQFTADCWLLLWFDAYRHCAGFVEVYRDVVRQRGESFGGVGTNGRLNHCSNQLTHSTVYMKHTYTYTVDITVISSIWGAASLWFSCGASDIWKKMSIGYFASFTLCNICVKCCDGGISDWELWKVL